ncbi:DegQ family serine endoprotease [Pseudoxanthobacter sp.]|uniref:DegQ family serine endoprotease n=1 Tax=Pseudoxanthobacter sp. TaxID=1925742 RepID=UPI002FE3F287
MRVTPSSATVRTSAGALRAARLKQAGAVLGLAGALALAGALPGRAETAATPAVPVPAPGHPAGPASVADLAEGLLDAVVNISTSQKVEAPSQVPVPKLPEGSPFQDFFDQFMDRQGKGADRPQRVQSLGSGFVIDPAGIVVTNNHVIDGADEITVNFSDGTKLKAEVVGRDKKTDLAVLKVKPEKPLKAVDLGDSNKIRVGDWVMAIGNPFGLGGTVTLGIVSARNRNINAGPYDDFIQTDTAINRGNSGGPLFDMYGKVIGINTAIISPSGGSIGIGFAIPASTASHVITQLREFGETRRGWLGVRIQEVSDDIAEGLGLKSAKGALVAGVTADGPAAKAGIEPGDVILTFDGQPVPKMSDLPRMVADTGIGKKVDVVIVRKGKEQTLQVELQRLDEKAEPGDEAGDAGDKAPKAAATEVAGLKLSAITAELKAKFKIADSVKGVLVTDVDPASNAAEKRVQAGDVIVEVAQEPVTSPQDVAERIAKAKKDGRKTVLLLLANPSGDLRFTAIRISE